MQFFHFVNRNLGNFRPQKSCTAETAQTPGARAKLGAVGMYGLDHTAEVQTSSAHDAGYGAYTVTEISVSHV